MKNIIRRAAYAVVALASMFSVSCSSDLDEITKPSNGSNNTSTSGITKLNASISQEESMATKAVLGQKGSDGVYPITWQSGDKIAVSNTQAAPSVFSAESVGAQTSFSLSSGDPINAKTTQAVSALYPAGMVTGFTAGKYVVDLPKVQKYTSGTFDQNAYLMGAYATVTENSNPNLEFKSLCSVLDLQVNSSYDTRVKRIIISSTSPLSGKGEVTLSGDIKELKMDQTEGSTSVILDCGESGVELKKGVAKNFYVVLPAKTYIELNINVESTDGKYQFFSATNVTFKFAKLSIVPLTYKGSSRIPILIWAPGLRATMKKAAGNNFGNIRHIVFEANSTKTSKTKVHDEDDWSYPIIYLSYDNGTITFSTPAVKMKAAFNSFFSSAYGEREGLFENFTNLESIDGLENIDTSNVTDMPAMFKGCSSLRFLDLSSFNTSNVTSTMNFMFDGCSSLSYLNVNGFDTSKVSEMWGMFRDCSSLTSLDLSSFKTSKCEDQDEMFSGCSNLASLDISQFSVVSGDSKMLLGVKSDIKIYCKPELIDKLKKMVPDASFLPPTRP